MWSETKMRLMNKSVGTVQLNCRRMILFTAKNNLASVILTHSLQASLFIAQCLRTADLFYYCTSQYINFPTWNWHRWWESCSGASLSNKKQDNPSCLSGAIEAERSIQEFKTKPSQVQSHFINWLVKREANVYGQLLWREALVSLAWKL